MLTVTPIPAFKDNYLWLIENDNECWVVDPGDAEPVKAAIASRDRELTGILVTHHHADHVGGIKQLLTSEMKVIGPSLKPHPLVRDPVSDGDIRRICDIDVQIIGVPGHTLNHLAYYFQTDRIHDNKDSDQPLLFCGDTLFAGGCGRLFEGSPEQMHDSLSKLSQLPEKTLVYCAHEYTLANLEFALSIEPGNQDLIAHQQNMMHLRSRNTPTIPTTIAVERATNPFLRSHSDEVKSTALAFDAKTGSEHSPSVHVGRYSTSLARRLFCLELSCLMRTRGLRNKIMGGATVDNLSFCAKAATHTTHCCHTHHTQLPHTPHTTATHTTHTNTIA